MVNQKPNKTIATTQKSIHFAKKELPWQVMDSFLGNFFCLVLVINAFKAVKTRAFVC